MAITGIGNGYSRAYIMFALKQLETLYQERMTRNGNHESRELAQTNLDDHGQQ